LAQLPKLLFDGNKLHRSSTESHIYSLSIKYNVVKRWEGAQHPGPDDKAEAAIIVGRICFSNNGSATAEGADWDRLLSGQRQTQLPYSHGARGVAAWRSHKLTEPWADGDILHLKVDLAENTVQFRKGTGTWKTLWNVLQFTNNPSNPESVALNVFCGYTSNSSTNCKLTIMSTDEAQRAGTEEF